MRGGATKRPALFRFRILLDPRVSGSTPPVDGATGNIDLLCASGGHLAECKPPFLKPRRLRPAAASAPIVSDLKFEISFVCLWPMA